jgi:hypothetical protein
MKKILLIALVFFSFNTNANNYYGMTVIDSNILQGNLGNSQSNPADILGITDGKAVSLGGSGGWITIELDEKIFNGDGPDFEVKEEGSSNGGVDENYLVYVSESNASNSFVELGEGRAKTLFDISSLNLNFVKYIKIYDLSSQTLDTDYPGSDIDSITILNSESGPTSGINNLEAKLTGKGVFLSWDLNTPELIASYAIRRSEDGVTFYSNVDWTVGRYEHAILIENNESLPLMWYAVSPIYEDGTEGISKVINLGDVLKEITINETIFHLGDKYISGWDVPGFQKNVVFEINLNQPMVGPYVEIELEVYNVHYENKIMINGYYEKSLPIHNPSEFSNYIVYVKSDAFKVGLNKIVIHALDSLGGTEGNLDDFQLRNINIKYLN